MSLTSPWFALAADWYESEMFDGTTAAQKLAFIGLLTFSKSRGRAGKFTLRSTVLCRELGIDPEDVEEMLKRAIDAGCIDFDGSVVHFKNWAQYQDPSKRRSSLVKEGSFTKMSATTHQAPSTHHHSPSTSSDDSDNPSRAQKPHVRWTTSGWIGITDELKAKWREAFPACDIDRQLKAMDAWCQANPAKARKSNWTRFIVNWLTKEQDRGGDAKSNRPNANISRVAAKPGKYANVGITLDATAPSRTSETS